METEDYYLTTQELASKLGITYKAILKYMNDNSIPYIKGREKSIRIPPSSVRAILEKKGILAHVINELFGEGGVLRTAQHTVKGGVGKTTLTYLLATRFAAFGLRTLLVDVDKQANATSKFGIDAKKSARHLKTLADLYDDVINDDIEELDYTKFFLKVTDYLSLLPANLNLSNFDNTLILGNEIYTTIMSEMLGPVEEDYDVIMFDMPADFNRVTKSIHSYIDKLLIPTELEEDAIYGVDLTYDHSRLVQKKSKKHVDKLVVVNMFHGSYTQNLSFLENLLKLYGTDIAEKTISISKPLRDAIKDKKDVWHLDRKKCLALDGLDALVDQILGVKDWPSLNKAQGKVAKSRKISKVGVVNSEAVL